MDYDFTTRAYQELLEAGLRNYSFISYDKISYEKRCIIWRHDCDFSLNRALAIAKIDASYGVIATFFINIHSEYYNILEASQYSIIQEIFDLGHHIGIHYDSDFYSSEDEKQLVEKLSLEKRYFKDFLGISPKVFSFHNPTKLHLTFNKHKYANLINCYSKTLQTRFKYCSDSNGMWRHENLHALLREAEAPFLHVLTHPGWWQEKAMPPRSKIFRATYGRAAANQRLLDNRLISGARETWAGNSKILWSIKDIYPEQFDYLDFLWSTEKYDALNLELCNFLKSVILQICIQFFQRKYPRFKNDIYIYLSEKISFAEINILFKKILIEKDNQDLIGKLKNREDHQVLEFSSMLNPNITKIDHIVSKCIENVGFIKEIIDWAGLMNFKVLDYIEGKNSTIGTQTSTCDNDKLVSDYNPNWKNEIIRLMRDA